MSRYTSIARLIHYCIFLLQAYQKSPSLLCGFQLPILGLWVGFLIRAYPPFPPRPNHLATTPKPVSEPTQVDIQRITIGITTRYGLDHPGFETQWGCEIFRTCPHRPWFPPTLQYDTDSCFSCGTATGAWRLPPSPI